MKQTVNGISVSDNQQAQAIERAINFYRDHHPKSAPDVTVKFNLAALAAALMTLQKDHADALARIAELEALLAKKAKA